MNTWTCGNQPAHQSLFTRVAGHVPTDRRHTYQTGAISAANRSPRRLSLQKDIRGDAPDLSPVPPRMAGLPGDARVALNLRFDNATFIAVEAVPRAFRRHLRPQRAISFAQILPAASRAHFVADWHLADLIHPAPAPTGRPKRKPCPPSQPHPTIVSPRPTLPQPPSAAATLRRIVWSPFILAQIFRGEARMPAFALGGLPPATQVSAFQRPL